MLGLIDSIFRSAAPAARSNSTATALYGFSLLDGLIEQVPKLSLVMAGITLGSMASPAVAIVAGATTAAFTACASEATSKAIAKSILWSAAGSIIGFEHTHNLSLSVVFGIALGSVFGFNNYINSLKEETELPNIHELSAPSAPFFATSPASRQYYGPESLKECEIFNIENAYFQMQNPEPLTNFG